MPALQTIHSDTGAFFLHFNSVMHFHSFIQGELRQCISLAQRSLSFDRSEGAQGRVERCIMNNTRSVVPGFKSASQSLPLKRTIGRALVHCMLIRML